MKDGQRFYICSECEISIITQGQLLEEGHTNTRHRAIKCQNCGNNFFFDAVITSEGQARTLRSEDVAVLQEG